MLLHLEAQLRFYKNHKLNCRFGHIGPQKGFALILHISGYIQYLLRRSRRILVCYPISVLPRGVRALMLRGKVRKARSKR